MGTGARSEGLPGWDALAVFSVTLAHCLALQVLKDARSLPSLGPSTAWRWTPTALLALSVARVHAAPRSTDALVALAMNGIITLACNGSQSNHVLLELAMCAAVLLCAPSVTSGRRRASSTEMDPSRARRAFSRRLTFSTRAALCVLYATTGFAKLNDDWHDPNVSCCVQMLVGALSGMGLDARHVSVVAPERLRAFIPYAATAFELGFPLLCVTSTCRIFGGRGFAWDGGAPTTVRLLTAVGASFHALIAMPPPPMSVYPFSMIMAPMYVAGAVPHETGVAASAFAARWKSGGASFRAGVWAVAILAVAVAIKQHEAHSYFEYPPYFAWELGALWVVCAFGALAYAALRGTRGTSTSSSEGNGGEEFEKGDEGLSRRARAKALAPAAFIFLVSASTYVGVRTYPSFAMFSNLRVEGGASNHWVFRNHHPMNLDAFDPIAAGRDETYRHGVLVTETNLPSLRTAQVNLAPLLPSATIDALNAAGCRREFHVTPPKWPYPPTEPVFVPYAIPPVEVRRRVASALKDGTGMADFFVEYRWVRGGTEEDGPVRRLVVKGGKVVVGAESGLAVGLGAFEGWLRRFRTFDVGSSPCRH
ncbi:predicted protein [Micromonas commoda]|uniref:Uncharacterized protein n=1 Tax=Micromonas commoda (strain RCC299 / NOUM17 / CCMP2709) TaxID=296587 RepID=C1EH68_MICCC|nr:predicted protein [Micromonas commoda]ACO67243.1 predicted protein [Micromonas commoda]|eukprot:XP_002505985.1 predicted protein [Micromonas commoda]